MLFCPLLGLSDLKVGKPFGNFSFKFQSGMIETYSLLPDTPPSMQRKCLNCSDSSQALLWIQLCAAPPQAKPSWSLSLSKPPGALPGYSAVPSSEAGTVPRSSLLSPGTSIIPTLFIFSLRILFRLWYKLRLQRGWIWRARGLETWGEKDIETELRTAWGPCNGCVLWEGGWRERN